MLDIGIQACEVEAVEDVVFFDFAEVLVAFRGQEPRDPLLLCVKTATCRVLGI